MTTANIFSVGKNSNVYGALESGNKSDSKQVAEEAAEIFGAVMNQMSQDLATMQSEGNSMEEVSFVSSDMDSGKNAYKYSPKENRIEQATQSDSNVQNEVVEQKVEELAEDVVETISEKLNVSKEEILAAMEELGISETDLLLPGKLGQLVMELTGETDVFHLLTNSDFQAVLQGISEMEKETAATLGMDLNQFRDNLQEMNQQQVTLETGNSEEIAQNPNEIIKNELPTESLADETAATEDVRFVENSEMVEQTDLILNVEEQNGVKSKQDLITDDVAKMEDESLVGELTQEQTSGDDLAKDELDAKLNQDAEIQNVPGQDDLAEQAGSKKMDQFQNDNSQGHGRFEGRDAHHNDGITVSAGNVTGDIIGNVMAEESFSEISYSNIDVDDLMQQFVEKTQLTVMENKTTMDMQLNPENLGKIYLHISTEEGSVHAQITATNEIVKEALEAQLATLRENLNQAGVKVDSVEVSVATHEFEQNLEQHSKQEEEQARLQEENSRTRRNLNLNSLDELAGVLSEEEVLVAQMMRDHGNSVDFTA